MLSWGCDSPSRDARRKAAAMLGVMFTQRQRFEGCGSESDKESDPRVSYINTKLPSQHLNKGN